LPIDDFRFENRHQPAIEDRQSPIENQSMLKVGLTGGIASGKSVVGEMFVSLGAHLVEADRIAHSLMRPGQAVYNEIVRHFGREILNADGGINRAKLAELAFGPTTGDAGKRASRIQELNRIVHPAVIRNHDEWMRQIGRQDPSGVAIVEAALILEAGARDHFDRIIVVTCNAVQRTERFAMRQKVDLESARREVERRMAAQLSDEEKIKSADYVIDNSGAIESTREEVGRVWAQLRARTSSPAQ
jgi:dephospho-CoA kinase